MTLGRRNSGKAKIVPKLKLKVSAKAVPRKLVTPKSIKKPLVVKKPRGGGVVRTPKKTPPAVRGRGRLNIKIRRQKSPRKFDDDDLDEDEEDTDNDDSHEVFQLTPSSSKNLKLIVRKKTIRPARRGGKTVRLPIRVPIRRKKVEESDNSSDESDNDVTDVSDDGSVESEEVPVVVIAKRLKTKRPALRKRKR